MLYSMAEKVFGQWVQSNQTLFHWATSRLKHISDVQLCRLHLARSVLTGRRHTQDCTTAFDLLLLPHEFRAVVVNDLNVSHKHLKYQDSSPEIETGINTHKQKN
jgi:hypothetical protein